MKRFIRPCFVSLVVLASAACGESKSEDPPAGTSGSAGSSSGSAGTSPGGTGGTGGAAPTCSSAIVADALNNYAFQSTLTMPSVPIKPDSDITFEWGGLTKDFMKHDVDPRAGIDTVNVMLWSLTEEELQIKLNADQLSMRDTEIPVALQTMKMLTSAKLIDFDAPTGEPLEPSQILPYMNATDYPPEDHTYTVILATGDLLAGGGEARMIQSFKLDPASTNTTVTLTNDSTKLAYEANLHNLNPTMVPAGTAAISIDWTNMLLTSLGTEFLPSQITAARIARYDETPAELEAKFLDLELIDEETYETAVSEGTSISFDKFKTEAGAAFTGINASGTWMLALSCGSCRNPAPWYMTILKPCN